MKNELYWGFLTIVVFYLFSKLYEKKKAFYLNPLMLSIIAIASILHLTGIKYETYIESARILSFFLGPAVVSLAVPLYKQKEIIKAYSKQIFAGIAFGGTLAILSAFYVAKLLGGSEEVLLSITPKSITTAIAIGVSEKIGAALTAVLVILTGIFGNAIGIEMLNAFKIKNRVARELAMEVTSHGLGTARIILNDELSGAVSSLAMALNGVFTSLILPYLIELLQ